MKFTTFLKFILIMTAVYQISSLSNQAGTNTLVNHDVISNYRKETLKESLANLRISDSNKKKSQINIFSNNPIEPHYVGYKRVDKLEEENSNLSLKSKTNNDLEVTYGKCFFIFGNNFYDFSTFDTMEIDNNGDKLQFSFCKDIKIDIEKCKKSGLLMSEDKCLSYSSNSKNEKKWTKNIHNKKIEVNFPDGDFCRTNTNGNKENYSLTVNAICNEEIEKYKIKDVKDFDTCKPSFTVESKSACSSYQYSPWVENIKVSKPVIIAVFLILGISLLFFGKILDIIVSVVLTSFFGGLIMYSTLGEYLSTTPIYCKYFNYNFILYSDFFIASSLITLILCLIWDDIVVSYILAVIVGYICGNIFFDILDSTFSADSTAAYLISIILFIVLFIIIKTKIQDFLRIILTSLFGAYLVVRAFTFFNTNYPDEAYLSALIKHKEMSAFNRMLDRNMAIYFLVFILLFIIGSVFQFNQIEEGDEKGGKEKDSETTKE